MSYKHVLFVSTTNHVGCLLVMVGHIGAMHFLCCFCCFNEFW